MSVRAGVVVPDGDVSPGCRTIVVCCGGGVYAIGRCIAVDGINRGCVGCAFGVNVIGRVMMVAMSPLLIKEYRQRYIYFSRVYTFYLVGFFV